MPHALTLLYTACLHGVQGGLVFEVFLPLLSRLLRVLWGPDTPCSLMGTVSLLYLNTWFVMVQEPVGSVFKTTLQGHSQGIGTLVLYPLDLVSDNV